MGKLIDLSGKKFGKLTVICLGPDYVYENGHCDKVWHCRCDCGKEVDVMAKNLRRYHTTSCGCARVDAGERRRFDVAGERFGHLIAIKQVEYPKAGGSKWLFQCDCGNQIVTYLSNVQRGKTRSCGAKDCGYHEHYVKDKTK